MSSQRGRKSFKIRHIPQPKSTMRWTCEDELVLTLERGHIQITLPLALRLTPFFNHF